MDQLRRKFMLPPRSDPLGSILFRSWSACLKAGVMSKASPASLTRERRRVVVYAMSGMVSWPR